MVSQDTRQGSSEGASGAKTALVPGVPDELAALMGQLPAITSLRPRADPLQQGRLRTGIVELARQLGDPRWGSEGTIESAVTTVEYYRLWPNPMRAITYSRAEIDSMSGSLRTEGQKTPLIVTKCQDPRPDEDGGTGGDILIIDGEKRHAAAPKAALTHLHVIFRDYPHIYAAMLDATIIKTTQHDLTDHDIGRSIMRLEIAYAVTVQQYPELNLPRLTDERLATMIGRDRSTVTRWRNLGRLEDVTVDLLDKGAITPTQAMEMLPLTPEDRIDLAQSLADQNSAAKRPLSQSRVRQMVKEKKHGPAEWFSARPIEPPLDLWMPGQGDYPNAVAIAAHIHDLVAWLRVLIPTLDHPHKDLVDALRILERPSLQSQVDELSDTVRRSMQ